MDTILDIALPVLTITPLRWEEIVKAIPGGLLIRRPAGREWSAVECLQHLLDSEEIFTARIQHFLAGEDIPNFDPDKGSIGLDRSADLAGMAARFARLRQKNLDSLTRLTPEDYQRRVRHSELGMVALGEMIHEWAAHDLNHTIQAERAIMQPLIQESGPWRVYFQDHVILQAAKTPHNT
jgi:hypothetical protein